MRAWIELYGTVILLVPFVIMILWFSMPFVTQSFAVGEVSQSPGGLPFRWLIKAMLPVGMALLLLGIISRTLIETREDAPGCHARRWPGWGRGGRRRGLISLSFAVL